MRNVVLIALALLSPPAPGVAPWDEWIRQLERGDAMAAESARRALIDGGVPAQAAVLEALRGASPSLAAALLDVLRFPCGSHALAVLDRFLSDLDSPVAAPALRCRARLAPDLACETARRALHSRHWSVRRAALEVLRELDADAALVLRELARDADPTVRALALDTLARLRQARAAPAFIELAADPGDSLCGWAIEQLAALRDPELLPFFEGLLRLPSHAAFIAPLQSAVLLLRSDRDLAPSSNLVAVFETAVGQPPFDRELALHALAAQGTGIVVPLVTFVLERTEPGLAETLLALVPRIEGPVAIQTLRTVAISPDAAETTRRAAVRVLGSLPSEATAEALRLHVYPHSDSDTRALIVDMVASFPASPACDDLLAAGLEHPSPLTRRRAFRALASREDPRFQPLLAQVIEREEHGEIAADMIRAAAQAYGAEDPGWALRLLSREMNARTEERRLAALESHVCVSLGDAAGAVADQVWLRFAPQAAADTRTCRRLIHVLTRIGGSKAAGHVRELFEPLETRGDVRTLEYLLDQCVQVSEEPVRAQVWKELRHASADIRAATLETLCEWRDPAVLSEAGSLLGTFDAETRARVVRRLAGLRPDPRLTSLIQQLLEIEPEPSPQLAALEAASQIATPELAPAVLAMARDAENAELREAALWTLGAFGGLPEIEGYLRGEASSARPLASLDEDERLRRRQAAASLSRSRPEEGVLHLVPHLFAGALKNWRRLLGESLSERRGSLAGANLDDMVLQALHDHPAIGVSALGRHLEELREDGSLYHLPEEVLLGVALALRSIPEYRVIVLRLLELVAIAAPTDGDSDFVASWVLASLARLEGRHADAARQFGECARLALWGHPTKRLLHDVLGEADPFSGRSWVKWLLCEAAMSRARQAAAWGPESASALADAVAAADHDAELRAEICALALELGAPPAWAVEVAEAGLEETPYRADLLDLHALAASLAGGEDRARSSRERLRQMITAGLTVDKAVYHLHAAVVAAALGETERARAEILRALRLDPQLRGWAPQLTITRRLKGYPEVWALLVEGS
ncbi:MAG: HEAT repeat domain-containing protein [Planctomycetota bacterium]